MRVLVIGGTGHIGSYLVPRLMEMGCEVSVVARTPEPRYADARLGWDRVRWIVADRKEEEATDAWAERMRGLDAEVVIDLVCYEPAQQQTMTDAFIGRIDHFLHCGTIWAYGPTHRAPCHESDPRRPTTDYGRNKRDIESMLLERWRSDGFPATVVHPGHISGRRWLPIDPQGSRDGTEVYRRLATGEPVVLPDLGLATLHHVHADDVAQVFTLTVAQRGRSLGESFSAVAPHAMTLLGCCHAVASLFGREPNLQYVPLEQLDRHLSAKSAGIVREHVTHSPCCSIEKAQRLLGYAPRYTPTQIFRECVEHMVESGQLQLPDSVQTPA